MAASYRFGVKWIALNDEPSEMDPNTIETLISVALLADLFGHSTRKVALDILKFKTKTQNNT